MKPPILRVSSLLLVFGIKRFPPNKGGSEV